MKKTKIYSKYKYIDLFIYKKKMLIIFLRKIIKKINNFKKTNWKIFILFSTFLIEIYYIFQ